MSFAQQLGVNQRSLKVETNIPVALNADKITSVNLVRTNISIPNNASSAEQWIEYGNQLYRLGEYTNSVTAFNLAITLQPNSLDAYYGQGLALRDNGTSAAALIAFDKAIVLVPPGSQSKFYYLWKYRGAVLYNLGDKKGAIADYDIAIRINPQSANTYSNRGKAKSGLGDKKGAIADYDIAIRINPQSADAYYNRAVAKSKLGDKKGALADYDRAISLQERSANSIAPQSAEAYANRGSVKSDLGDKKGALADYDKAISLQERSANSINPQDAVAYYSRGITRSALGDKRGAIADYDTVIGINPQDAAAYANRGIAKSSLGDKKGAIADYQIAAKIFRAENNLALYDRVMSLIQQMSN